MIRTAGRWKSEQIAVYSERGSDKTQLWIVQCPDLDMGRWRTTSEPGLDRFVPCRKKGSEISMCAWTRCSSLAGLQTSKAARKEEETWAGKIQD